MNDEIFGYFLTVQLIALQNMSVYNDEDVKDAVAQLVCKVQHFTDKDLDEALISFRKIESELALLLDIMTDA